MTHLKPSRRASLMAACLASTALTSHVVAQDAAEEEEDLGFEEILVTVERRSQSLQDLAGTAAVLSGDDIKMLGLQNINALDGKIPGLSIANNQGNIEVYIRGVGSANNTELGDPAAATHMNGVYIPRPSGFGAAFFDIQRVEVNIGPQGTLRGRNATAGSVNVIPWAPGIGQQELAFEAGFGNYNEITGEAVINTPVTENSALRVAAFFRNHDSRLINITPDSSDLGLDVPTSDAEGIGVAEAAEDFGLRVGYKVEVNDKIDFTITGDYLSQQGTGYTGVNFANPLGNGIDPDSIENPRRVYGRAFTPDEDTVHWGIMGQANYDGDGFNIEYIGSFRDLVYEYEFVTPAGPEYPGALETFEPFVGTFDNFSRVNFITDSESIIQELRVFSEDDATLQWTAGAFYFKEDQKTFLGTTGDRNPFFSGVEFNQRTDTESFSFYGDATYNVNEKFRVTGGLRYTKDVKERFGVNARYQFITGGAGFSVIGIGQGTEGFEFAGLDRTIFNPDTDGDGNLSDAEVLEFYFDGVAQPGARDGFDDIFGGLAIIPGDAPPEGRPQCANFAVSAPGCPIDGAEPFFDEGLDGLISFAVLGGNSIAIQNGRLNNDFVDWRIRLEYDISDDNLIYGLVSTGNKSGGFNDNIAATEGLGLASAVSSAPAAFSTDTLAPTYGPETLTLYEVGSKNMFDVGDVGVKLNVSAFYYDYQDLQQTTLTSVAQVLDFTGIEIPDDVVDGTGLGGQVVAFTFNAADAEIYGTQIENGLYFDNGWSIESTLLWMAEARIQNALEIQDFRFQADVDPVNAINRSINGKRLIRTPEIQFNTSIAKVVETDFGQIDGILSLGYRSSQFMTIFNGEVFDSIPDEQAARLNDRVPGYWNVDLGVGVNIGQGDKPWRIEAYASNLTNITRSQAIIITQFDNTRFFNAPRLYGVRCAGAQALLSSIYCWGMHLCIPFFVIKFKGASYANQSVRSDGRSCHYAHTCG